MTKERRELLRELCKKATPGPWLHTWKDCFMCMSSDFIDRKGDDIGIALVTADINQTNAMLYATDIDMDFIAAARTALPELLDEVEAVEAQLREVVAQAKQQLRDEQEASGVDLGKMDRRQDRMVAEMRVLQQRAEAAKASAVVAREALEREQWDDVVEDRGYRAHWCRRCTGSKAVGHDKDCPIGLALADDAGVKMLKERERLQEFVATMRERRGCHRSRVTYSTTDDMCFSCDTAVICRALVVLDTKGVLEE